MKQCFLMMVLIMTNLCFADYRHDQVEVRGKVIGINDHYVTLLAKNKKTFAPIQFVSQKQLNSQDEIVIFIPSGDYFALVKHLNGLKK